MNELFMLWVYRNNGEDKMMRYWQIMSGAGIGGQAGVAYIKEYNGVDLLPKEGRVEGWVAKHFTLKNGEYTDFLPANIGCRLCSEKLRGVLEKYKSEKDTLQWLDAEVEDITGDKRKYYILHFPELKDLLDKKRSKYVRSILTKHVIDAKLCIGHEVFSYKECSSLSFVVSQTVKEELQKEACQGLVYLDAASHKKGIWDRVVTKALRRLNEKRAIQKASAKGGPSKQVTCLEHLKSLNLPNDLIDFIREDEILVYNEEECTVGRVELVSIDFLASGRIYVEPKSETSKKGYYTIPAVDLIAECEGFDAWGILVWLPDIQMYGTWDSDYRILRVFPGAGWIDIAKQPLRYLNALWKPAEVENEIFFPDDRFIFTEEAK